MDKRIGVGLAVFCAKIFAFAGSAVFTAALRVPGVVASLV